MADLPTPVGGSRARLVACLLGAPAVCVALGLAVIEGSDVLRPPSALARPAASATLADAIRRREVEGAYAIIRSGQDPNASLTFRDAVLTGGREVRVLPLLLAVAVRDDNTVSMLLSVGARLDPPMRARAICLARRVGAADIAALLREPGPAPSGGGPSCPDPAPGEALLTGAAP